MKFKFYQEVTGVAGGFFEGVAGNCINSRPAEIGDDYLVRFETDPGEFIEIWLNEHDLEGASE